jgi:hypothetical protein
MSSGWVERQAGLLRLAERQLFFVGGAPRSGTTWLQHLLDSHPDISCSGEGLFMKHLAEPLDAMMAQRREAIAAKNATVFRHTAGYPEPAPEDADQLLGTAVLLALERQCAGKACRAVGEKTPENVFLFARLKRVFPRAKFIGIARDPRDVLSSAWHFFHRPKPGEEEAAAKVAFIRNALPSIALGARAMLALRERYAADCLIVTYEQMHAATAAVAARLFGFLGVTDSEDVVADSVARTSFAAMGGGAGGFLRKGVVGDWSSALTPAMGEMILRDIGWAFPHFGWTP